MGLDLPEQPTAARACISVIQTPKPLHENFTLSTSLALRALSGEAIGSEAKSSNPAIIILPLCTGIKGNSLLSVIH